jgi:hypothetical protein
MFNELTLITYNYFRQKYESNIIVLYFAQFYEEVLVLKFKYNCKKSKTKQTKNTIASEGV